MRAAAAYPALQKAAFLCIDDHENLLECEESFLESFGSTVLTSAKRWHETKAYVIKDRPIGSEYE